jgi:hypothetical protein
MKGYLKVVGTNDGCESLMDASGLSEINYKFHKNYELKFKNEIFFLEILEFIICDTFIEYSGWIGDKNHKYGRIAFQFEPKS